MRRLLPLLLSLPLIAAAPLSCAGVAAPGLAYPDAAGEWKGSEITFCHRIAVLLHRTPERFSPILEASDAPRRHAADLLFIPRGVVPAGFRERRVLADDYAALLVPSDSRARSAADLRGRPICVEPGSPEERSLAGYFAARRWRLDEFVFQEVDEMHDAYLAGRCDAVVSEISLLVGLRGNAAGQHRADRILPDHLGENPIVIAAPSGDAALIQAIGDR